MSQRVSLCVLYFLLSQVKAAFTRTYNKEVHLTPYSLQVVKKGRRGGGGGESELAGEDGENVVLESEEEEEEGLQKDAMIKVGPPARANQPQLCVHPLFCVNFVCFPPKQQKKSKATKESKKEVKEDSGKGKGKGKGKGPGRGGSKGASRGK